MKCKRCHKNIPASARYCPHCGRRQHFSVVKLLLQMALVVVLFLMFIYRTDIYHYFKNDDISPLTDILEKDKNAHVFEAYKDCIFGIDVSQFQGDIDWEELQYIKPSLPISFVFVRATMGDDGADRNFSTNWEKAKYEGLIRGAYHYYRPNENSLDQAENYIKTVDFKKGDIVPVLDIEEISTKQNMTNLRLGLKRWLTRVEEHYGVEPIIYTADKFYDSYLSNGEFDDYTIWIANFNSVKKPQSEEWKIWQFTEKGRIEGINQFVDLNVFNGDIEDFEKLRIK